MNMARGMSNHDTIQIWSDALTILKVVSWAPSDRSTRQTLGDDNTTVYCSQCIAVHRMHGGE